MLEGKKVVLAYSGGLDTSVCVKWLEQQGAEPYALYLDLGQGEPSEDVKAKALEIGATDAFVRDARAEFAKEYVAPAIMANALYGGKYPLFTALGRPLIAKKLVETAREVGATHIAHGSTRTSGVALSKQDPWKTLTTNLPKTSSRSPLLRSTPQTSRSTSSSASKGACQRRSMGKSCRL
jgi:tRNA U34 2-thiouridine synthase MnmA/TrmU